MKESLRGALKFVFAFVLVGLFSFIVVSVSHYIFEEIDMGRSVMASMLEWASSGTNWIILLIAATCFMIYGLARAIPLWRMSKFERMAYEYSWRDEMSYGSLIIAKVLLIWTIFGRTFHH